MRLDLSKIPMDITFKNDGERTKMLLGKLVSKYVDNGETITITANSSDEAAIIYTRLKDLGISTDDSGDGGDEDVDTLPDKLYRYNDITINFKDIISPNIYSNYETLFVNYVNVVVQMMEFQKEHEAKGDMDDPEVQAEYARLLALIDTKQAELSQTYGYIISNNDVTVCLFDALMQNIGIASIVQNNTTIIYITPKMAKMLPMIAVVEAGPDYVMDISKVTKPGWYIQTSDTQHMDITPCDVPSNILVSNANITHNEEIPYIEKSIYKGIFKDVETKNEIKEYVLNIVGLEEYTQEYTLNISANMDYHMRLGYEDHFRYFIPLDYTGDIQLSIDLDIGEVAEVFSTTLTLDMFEDYHYDIDLSGHK